MAAARGISGSGSGALRALARPARHGGLTLALLTLATAPAAAATGPGVEVRLGSRTAFVAPDELAAQADVPATNYTLRGAPDDPGQVVVHAGVSVRKLLVLAGANPDQVSFIEVPRVDRGTAYLQRADFADPPPFSEGPALVWVDADATHFFRPVRDARDVNAPDNIATTSGVTLVVKAHTGTLLVVDANAGASRVKAREPVSFSARATGARPGETLRYRWSFDDGSVLTGPRVRHAFSAEGRYNVVVTVSGDQDSGGSGPVLPIQVGAPRKAKGTGSGGTNRDRGAPSSGPATGPSQGQGAAPPQPRTRPSAAAPRTPRRLRSSGATRTRRTRPAPSPEPPGATVRGILLAASSRPRAAARAGGSAGHLEIPAVAVAGAGLLLLGAGLELRRRPRAA